MASVSGVFFHDILFTCFASVFGIHQKITGDQLIFPSQINYTRNIYLGSPSVLTALMRMTLIHKILLYHFEWLLSLILRRLCCLNILQVSPLRHCSSQTRNINRTKVCVQLQNRGNSRFDQFNIISFFCAKMLLMPLISSLIYSMFSFLSDFAALCITCVQKIA